MSDTLEKALEVVGDWRGRHANETTVADLRRFFHGQRIVELGSDGTEFKIMGFDWSPKNGWQAKLARNPGDVAPFPLRPTRQIKPIDEVTVH
jgi:hypothetical protein